MTGHIVLFVLVAFIALVIVVIGAILLVVVPTAIVPADRPAARES